MSQKSRVQWLQESDKNSKFFHAYIVQRRKTNTIERLVKVEGGICETEEELEAEVTRFYSSLFTTFSPQVLQDLLQCMLLSITSVMNQFLTKLVGNTEIKLSLFAINSQKALGPDSMTPLFF